MWLIQASPPSGLILDTHLLLKGNQKGKVLINATGMFSTSMDVVYFNQFMYIEVPFHSLRGISRISIPSF